MLELIAEGVELNTVTVGDIVSSELVSVDEDESLDEVLEKMKAKGVRRVPVVSKDQALIGILALDDLVDFYAEQLSRIVAAMNKEQSYERKKRD